MSLPPCFLPASSIPLVARIDAFLCSCFILFLFRSSLLTFPRFFSLSLPLVALLFPQVLMSSSIMSTTIHSESGKPRSPTRSKQGLASKSPFEKHFPRVISFLVLLFSIREWQELHLSSALFAIFCSWVLSLPPSSALGIFFFPSLPPALMSCCEALASRLGGLATPPPAATGALAAFSKQIS